MFLDWNFFNSGGEITEADIVLSYHRHMVVHMMS